MYIIFHNQSVTAHNTRNYTLFLLYLYLPFKSNKLYVNIWCNLWKNDENKTGFKLKKAKIHPPYHTTAIWRILMFFYRDTSFLPYG